MIELGRTVKDKVTGFTGVVTGYCTYLSGCCQVLVIPKVTKDGAYRDGQWFDEQRLSYVGSAKNRIVLDNGATPGFDKAAPIR